MKSETSKKANLTQSEERLYTFIGCLPIITVLSISFYLVYGDYVLNNYSFLKKSWHLSNVEKTSYDVNITCFDSDYATDRSNYPACAPVNCFRYFNDFYITYDEARALLKLAQKGWSLGDKSDSASFLSIETGTLNKGASEVKLKPEFYLKSELDVYNNVKQKILNHVKEKFNAQNLYLTNKNLFSSFSNNEPKARNLEYWHTQVDKKTRSWAQYTAVLFLNDFMADFFEGRIIFNNQDRETVLSIQPKLARLLVFSPGSENEYYYERLEYGKSYSLTIPLTCDKSFANL